MKPKLWCEHRTKLIRHSGRLCEINYSITLSIDSASNGVLRAEKHDGKSHRLNQVISAVQTSISLNLCVACGTTKPYMGVCVCFKEGRWVVDAADC